MRGFIKQYSDADFDPATISILEDAFEVARTRVQASKAPYGTEECARWACDHCHFHHQFSKSWRTRSPLAG